MVVKTYKAITLVSQANKPRVKRFKGSRIIFKTGTNRTFIKPNTPAPIINDFIPPVIERPGIREIVIQSEAKLTRKYLNITFTI